MRVLLGLGVMLLIFAVVVGPVAFHVLTDDPAPHAPVLVSFADNLHWIEWQPIYLQVTVAVLLVVLTLAMWLVLLLYAAAFIAQLRMFVSGGAERSGREPSLQE